MTFNDNDDPVALDLGVYFNAGGDGNDLTVYMRTLADGEVSFSAASQYVLGGGGFARFSLPADAQDLLDNLATGDRWIFKTARQGTQALSVAAEAGDPTASFNLRTVAPPAAQALSVAAEAGDPTATFNLAAVAPSLVLSDFAIPSGQRLVFSALILAGLSGEDRYNPDASTGTLVDGDLELAADLTINRVRIRADPARVTFGRTGASFEDYLLVGGALRDGTVYVQDADGVSGQAISDIADERIFPGGLNVDETLNQAFFDRIDGLSANDLFIVAFTEPSPAEELSVSATAGDPTATFNLRAVAPPAASALSMSATAGDPTASFSLRAVAPSIALALAMSAAAGDPTAAFNLRAIAPPATQALSISATAGDPSAVFNLAAVAPPSASALAMVAAAGDPTAAFNLRAVAPPATQALSVAADAGQPTATFELRALAPLLTLADSDDTGLEVDAKALMVASGPGTSGNNFYSDSDRGGTDTPLDGELGLGVDNTVISRFRRLSQTVLNLTDNDNPAALDIRAYFNTGGAGNDLTIYLQTLADGEVSFSASAQLGTGSASSAWFNLLADAQTLLDNLSTGDYWIFKTARPTAPEALSVAAVAGSPTATFDLRSIAPPATQALSMSAAAGDPTSSFNLRAVAPPATLALAMSATAGDPTSTFDLRAVAPGAPQALSVTARAGAPTATFALSTVAPSLVLGDFSIPSGQQLVFSGLILAGVSGEFRYNAATPTGVLADGDLDLAADITIDRIRSRASPDRVTFNRTGVGSLSDLLESGGSLRGGAVYVQDADGVTAQAVGDIGDDRINPGGINVDATLNQAFFDRVDGLAANDLFIVAFTEQEPAEELSVSAEAGDPTATFNLRVVAPSAAVQLSVVAEAGDPTAAFNLTAVAPPSALALAMSATAGDPTAAFNLRAVAPSAAEDLSVSAEAGDPTAAFALRAVAPSAAVGLSMSAETGDPTATFNLRTVAPSAAEQLSVAAAAGDPTANFNLRTVAPPATQSLSVSAEAGDPTARFNLSALLPEAVPDAPTMLGASEVDRDSATLRWTEPRDANPAISRYEVRIGTGAWISTGSVSTTHRLTGLAAGTEYSVTVRAVNSVGNSAASDAVTFRTLAILAPGPPIFPRFSVGAELHLDLLWEPPVNDGGGAITAYEARLTDEVGQTIGWEDAGDGASRRRRFRGLREGGRYRAVVRARNLAGVSDPSDETEGAPCVEPAAEPTA